MARNFTPRGKLQKREQCDLNLFSGATPINEKHATGVGPGHHGQKRGKLSDYGKQLRAKQMLKRMYGVLERQFYNYFREAFRRKGSTADELLMQLEQRLDNVVYRLGFARTRAEARQLVSHKSVIVNEEVVNIPSYNVREGETIKITEQKKDQLRIKEAVDLAQQKPMPEWIEVDHQNLEGMLKRLPERSELPPEINEQLVVELYSK